MLADKLMFVLCGTIFTLGVNMHGLLAVSWHNPERLTSSSSGNAWLAHSWHNLELHFNPAMNGLLTVAVTMHGLLGVSKANCMNY